MQDASLFGSCKTASYSAFGLTDEFRQVFSILIKYRTPFSFFLIQREERKEESGFDQIASVLKQVNLLRVWEYPVHSSALSYAPKLPKMVLSVSHNYLSRNATQLCFCRYQTFKGGSYTFQPRFVFITWNYMLVSILRATQTPLYEDAIADASPRIYHRIYHIGYFLFFLPLQPSLWHWYHIS